MNDINCPFCEVPMVAIEPKSNGIRGQRGTREEMCLLVCSSSCMVRLSLHETMQIQFWKSKAERTEAEKAKRDKAMEEAPVYFKQIADLTLMGATSEEATLRAAEAAPAYAEWRKSRGDL